MTGERYKLAKLDELDGFTTRHGYVWRPVRQQLGVRSFGINTNSGDAGTTLIEEHDEVGAPTPHEELYVVLSGTARFTLDGEELEAPSGTVVFVPDSSVKRAAAATADGTTLLCLGAPAGEVFKPSGWEFWRRAEHELKDGNEDRAVEIMRESLAEHESGENLYNLACVESLAGRRDDAIEHLRRALELSPNLKDGAKDDEDFASLREDARFDELVS